MKKGIFKKIELMDWSCYEKEKKKSLDTTTFPALERELETWLDASPFTNGLIARAEFPEIYTHHTVPRYRCMEILE